VEEDVIKIHVFIGAGSKPNNDDELIRAKIIVAQTSVGSNAPSEGTLT